MVSAHLPWDADEIRLDTSSPTASSQPAPSLLATNDILARSPDRNLAGSCALSGHWRNRTSWRLLLPDRCCIDQTSQRKCSTLSDREGKASWLPSAGGKARPFRLIRETP